MAEPEYDDTMIDHDKNVGTVLKAVDDLGIANNTFVIYSTDNGPHLNTWPDGATTPFRSEKNTNWEGAYRRSGDVSLAGQDQAGGGVQRHRRPLRLLPTLAAIAGDTTGKG